MCPNEHPHRLTRVIYMIGLSHPSICIRFISEPSAPSSSPNSAAPFIDTYIDFRFTHSHHAPMSRDDIRKLQVISSSCLDLNHRGWGEREKTSLMHHTGNASC